MFVQPISEEKRPMIYMIYYDQYLICKRVWDVFN